MTLRLALGLLVASVACGHGTSVHPVTMHIEPSATEYAAAMANAVAAWNLELEPTAPLRLEDQGTWSVITGDLPMGIWGTTDRDKRIVAFFPGLDPSNVPHMTMHELGHVIGLGHLPASVDGVMNAESNTSVLSRADLVACQRKALCRTDRALPDPSVAAGLVERNPSRCPLQEGEP